MRRTTRDEGQTQESHRRAWQHLRTAPLKTAAALFALVSTGCDSAVSPAHPAVHVPTAVSSTTTCPVGPHVPKVYVANANDTTTMYSTTGSSPVATIQESGYLAVDASGNLYVSDGNSQSPSYGTVTIYRPGCTSPATGISGLSLPGVLAIAHDQSVYVAGSNTIKVYGQLLSGLKRTITTKVYLPKAMTFDHAGNLYVVNSAQTGARGNVTVYASGTTKLIRTIVNGINDPSAIAVDAADNVYVSNYADGRGDSVTIYAAGSSRLLRTLKTYVGAPSGVAFDTSGHLYVANNHTPLSPPQGYDGIVVYMPPAWTIWHLMPGDYRPIVALQLDSKGDVYFAQQLGLGGFVQEFGPFGVKQLRQISIGLDSPISMALAP